VDGLLSGYVWDSGKVSWSAPRTAADYGSRYASDFDGDGRVAPRDGFAPLLATQVATAAAALEIGAPARAGFSIEGLTGLALARAAAGQIRLANTKDIPTAYAFTPGPAEGGDVWLGAAGRAPRVGNYDHLTILHEIGHSVGLKHSHESSGFGVLPRAVDSLEFTVMTYRPYVGGPVGAYSIEEWGAPQTYMMLDIAALQHLYGADFATNAGNTVYGWRPGSGRTWVDGTVALDPGANRIFATIWDGGGRDTYDLSAYRTGVAVDLRPGGASIFSQHQRADLGGGPNGGEARGNVFNALQHRGDPRSLIENAIGGSGNDRLIGNAAANLLRGGAGDDRLNGLGGGDALAGGTGSDVFVFSRLGDSAYGAPDRIVAADGAAAFQRPGTGAGDRFELRAIDADGLAAGNQAFDFGSKARGGLWLENSGATTYVLGNTDRDATAELRIAIVDGAIRAGQYGADDFLL
jgi:serralysin